MRLLGVELWAFRGIRHAAIELGPGLNVLYGPNDLGKSSLAEAIRAALLLTYSAAEGDKYHPWQEDAVPKVQLRFLHEGRTYRLTKSFGTGNRGGATLEVSRDGEKYAAEAKGREVEQKVRELLQWGVVNPGGKSGARGMPEEVRCPPSPPPSPRPPACVAAMPPETARGPMARWPVRLAPKYRMCPPSNCAPDYRR